jgi:hypothetical protein
VDTIRTYVFFVKFLSSLIPRAMQIQWRCRDEKRLGESVMERTYGPKFAYLQCFTCPDCNESETSTAPTGNRFLSEAD